MKYIVLVYKTMATSNSEWIILFYWFNFSYSLTIKQLANLKLALAFSPVLKIYPLEVSARPGIWDESAFQKIVRDLYFTPKKQKV